MDRLPTFTILFAYSDEMNRHLLDAAKSLAPTQLDQHFAMGVGSLRKTLLHILVGEQVWLERQRQNVEAKWPPYESSATPAEMLAAFETLWPQRDAFVASLTSEQLAADQRYRDSKGSLFTSSLHDMLIQGIVHSTHHRAQAVHMLKQVAGAFVEMDFMYTRRRKAD